MRVFALYCGVTALVACGGNRRLSEATTPGTAPVSAPAASAKTGFAAHDKLNAVLFIQTAGEYAALARQAYAVSSLALDAALADRQLSADPVQAAGGNYASLPPAVIVDVDETVLDNSAFEARLIRDGGSYSSAAWRAWTEEANALPVPGAVDFVRAAAAKGVTVFYVTNRRAEEEAATRRNLVAAGFPVPDRPDVLFTRGERPEWSSSDKTPRRAEVARTHRIVLLIGDNLGDFLEPGTTVEERRAAVEAHADYWGRRWIVLPNPTYGDWEGALLGGENGLPIEEQGRRRREALRY